jgi:hypothetical protein
MNVVRKDHCGQLDTNLARSAPLKIACAHAPSRHRHPLRVELEVPFKSVSRRVAVGLRIGEVRVDRPQFVDERLERAGIAFK